MNEEQFMNLIYIVCGVCCFMLLLLGMMLIYIIETRKYFKKLYYLSQKHDELQKELYNNLHEKIKNLREFRHDFRHHIRCMQQYCMEDKKEQLYEYVKNLGEYEKNFINIYTGNQVTDAICSYYSKEMNESKITFKWTGYLTNEIGMEMAEFCSLFSNAMENAVEACKQIDTKRYIEVDVQQNDEFIYIDMRNSIKEGNLNGQIFKTIKADRKKHGLGTKSMKRIIKKYDGHIEWTVKPKEMHLEIRLRKIIKH